MSKYNLGKWFKIDKEFEIANFKNKKINFFRNLHKLGFRYFNIHKRKISDKKVIRSFQQHYLPDNVNGKIDQKTFKISHFLTYKI